MKSYLRKILAIETSCDETAAAIIKAEGSPRASGGRASASRLDRVPGASGATRGLSINICANVVSSQIKIHQKFGGVFPEHASRAHTERILAVVEEALIKAEEICRLKDIDLIAVTTGPGLIGSLLVGVNSAKTLAYAHNLPIIGINHLAGHLYSNWTIKPFPQFPAILLIVSGGHTGLYLMKSHTDIKTLGETLDDAAGEAFDKVAKLLELGYPGGPAISKAALKGIPKAFDFPRSMLDRKDYDFSFSGLKTAVLYESKKHKLNYKIKADFAASFQQAVIDILVGKTIQAAYEYRPKSICLCGGVSANKNLREDLRKAVKKLPYKCSYHIPPMKLTTDNAAMIGVAAAYQSASWQTKKYTTYDKIKAKANLKL